jgi:hypothetical protein
MTFLRIAALAMAVIPFHGQAAQTPLQTGTFISEGGRGTLTISREPEGALRFDLGSEGGNGHICGLGGKIQNGKSIPEPMGDEPRPSTDKPCIVSFQREGTTVVVTDNHSMECRDYCGVRATYDGLYRTPLKGCLERALDKTKAEFRRFYDKKMYKEARGRLAPVLRDCAKTLGRLEEAWIRNDLAITQYRLGDFASCLQTLQPLAADAAMTDQELRESQDGPTTADNYEPVIKAARTNLNLCKAKAK